MRSLPDEPALRKSSRERSNHYISRLVGSVVSERFALPHLAIRKIDDRSGLVAVVRCTAAPIGLMNVRFGLKAAVRPQASNDCFAAAAAICPTWVNTCLIRFFCFRRTGEWSEAAGAVRNLEDVVIKL